MKRSVGFIITIFAVFFFVMGLFGYYMSKIDGIGLGGLPGKKKVAIVSILGTFSTKESDKILKIMHKYREDKNVAAVVLRIDSGGGGVAAAQEIMAEVNKLKAAGKKVVVSMGEVAASGGYYIACAADKIYANSGTLTGSIGVIMETPNLEELFKKVGMKTRVIKSGKFKDIGSVSREMSGEEKRLLQGMIDDVYEQFVEAIAAGRNMPAEEIRKYADGRVFSGRMALEYGLIDELGDLDDAVIAAARLADIKGKPSVLREDQRRGIFIPIPVEGLFDKIMGKTGYPVRLGYIFK